MSSSSSRRISSACSKGKIRGKKSTGELKFYCRTTDSTHETGIVEIPHNIGVTIDKFMTGMVGLHLPNGAVWTARYNRDLMIIEGLDALMKEFNVKCYHMFCFKYYGGTEFGLAIFNQYAVEICYSPRVENVGNSFNSVSNSTLNYDNVMDLTEYEKDKLHACFGFNAYTTFTAEYVFVITADHLQGKEWTLVLCEDACDELGLDGNEEWLEFGFKKFMWRIELKWEDGNVFFDMQWNTFAKAAKLEIGDNIMLLRSTHWQIFEVAVFENDCGNLFNKFGDNKGRCSDKWFKIMNWESAVIGDVEVPIIFAEHYSDKLKEDVTLLLADGAKYHGYFSKHGNLLYGLKKFMRTYSVKEKYVMFFELVGTSAFSVTIYNDEGEYIFNNAEKKSVFTPRMEVLEDVDEVGNENSVNATANDEVDVHARKKMKVEAVDLKSFSVVLLKSHVDQHGHGVFLPKYLIPIYRSWNKSTEIKLVMKGKSWKVSVLRRKKSCRIGVGWNLFTLQNKLQLGQKLIFSYVDEQIFEVNLVD